MQNTMTAAGIPEESIVFFKAFRTATSTYNIGLRMFTSDDWAWLHEAARVVHLPAFGPLTGNEDPARVADGNTLFVLAAGNMRESFEGDRDLYNINHPTRSHPDPRSDRARKEWYRNLLDVYNTGKSIAATTARVTESGAIEPNEYVVSCGDIKESCFTIIPRHNTSSASARLAAMSWYLFQFWETPEEVLETLSVCAIDIGESGIDREYGKGMVNLLCPRVLKKEVEVVSAHLGGREEKVLISGGGEIGGIWKAESTALQVYLPSALRETLQAEYAGVVNGTVVFDEGRAEANFTAKATVSVTFLLPIEARVEDIVQIEGEYVAEANRLSVQKGGNVLADYIYTATGDSLHLIRSLSLNDALRLIPGVIGDLAKKDTQPILEDDPIQIRMSFAKTAVSGTPENFRETEVTDNAVMLQWDEPENTGSSPVSAYRIIRYTDAACTVVSEVKETSRREMRFTNLAANTEYYFSIEVRNSTGWSEKSVCLKIRTSPIPGDFDGNNAVDITDFLLFVTAFGTSEGDAAFNEQMDLVRDGMINIADFLVFVENFGRTRNS